jgi:adenylosuccinate lyase
MLETRYSSKEMSAIWSEDNKLLVCRKLWVALAESQMELGLLDDEGNPRITEEKLKALKCQTKRISAYEKEKLAEIEKEVKHDVMAHIKLLGQVCPIASDIIHLGATSCDITDNADLILIKESLFLLRGKLVGVIDSLGSLAKINKDLPCVAFTHYQPAQLTTVGKRICLWANDLVNDLLEVERRIDKLAFRGMKGATGTQASYLQLFDGNVTKVYELEDKVTKKMGFSKIYNLTGQTYSRKIESQILHVMSGIAQSAHKFGTDMRLLQHDSEMQEPWGNSQIGSSAMPYKRNPMRCERLCSLSRYVINQCHSADYTAATQWLERTLDDSAVRRLTMPAIFMAVDGILSLYLNIANGIEIHRDVIRKNVWRQLPFMLAEPIMMAAVKGGCDRQEVHEIIRKESQKALNEVQMGRNNDLLRLLKANKVVGQFMNFDQNDFDPHKHTGCAPEQVDDFINNVVEPIRKKYPPDSVSQHYEVAC